MIYTNFDIDELRRKFKCCGKPSFEEELPETVVEGRFIILDDVLYVGHEGVWVSLGATPLSGTVDTLTYWDSASTLGSVTLGSGLDLTAGTLSVTGGSTGLEALDEGNGIGWRLIGRDAANYGNVGLNAIDFSYSNSASGTRGATGTSSFAIGSNTTSSGDWSFASGVDNESSGYCSSSFGEGNVATTDYTFSTGLLCSATGSNTFVSGLRCSADSFSSAVFGLNPTLPVGQNPTNYIATDELFKIGNGVNSSNRSDALVIYKNGVQQWGGITGTALEAVTAQDGMLAYVNATSAVFTSIGFWARENGTWNKL